MKHLNRRAPAFTLIELLIVVAIIAILAAIAIPNFLEAQTRAKVSRAKTDMRTLATAVESYIVDYNVAPFDGPLGVSCHWGWATTYQLTTTPVSYMTTVLADVFQVPQSDVGDSFSCRGSNGYRGQYDTTIFLDINAKDRHSYDYASRTWQTGWTGTYNEGTAEAWDERHDGSLYKIGSAGPDLTFSGGIGNFGFGEIYDPTNGTISTGNIYRWSGGQDE